MQYICLQISHLDILTHTYKYPTNNNTLFMKKSLINQKNKKSLIILNPLPVILLLATLVFGFGSHAQSSVTNGPESIVYKFSVSGVANPEEAAEVMALLMEESFSSSCTFIDEADCFKLSSELSDLTYDTLAAALKKEGFELSTEVLTSDGRSLHKTITIQK